MKAMTKRLLSMLVVLAMVLSMVPVVGLPAITANAAQATADITEAADALMTTFATANEEKTADTGWAEVSATCPACSPDTDVTWQPLTEIKGTTTVDAGSHFYLPDHFALPSTTARLLTVNNSGGTCCLHLNGKTLSGAPSPDGNYRFIYVAGNSTLNIMGQGNVVNSGGNDFVRTDNGAVSVWGGTYTATSTGVMFDLRGHGKAHHFYGNTIVNGTVEIGEAGNGNNLTLHDSATISTVDIKGTNGTYKFFLNVANGWSGAVNSLTVAATAEPVPAEYVKIAAGATVTGRIFTAAGDPYTQDSTNPTQFSIGAYPTDFDPEKYNGKSWCQECGEWITSWTAVDGTTVKRIGFIATAATHHYYIQNDFACNESGWFLNANAAGENVHLNMNGKKVTVGSATTGGVMAQNGGSVVIFNTATELGELTTCDNSTYGVANVNIGTFTLGSNVKLYSTSANANPVVTVAAGTFTMEAGSEVSASGTGVVAVQVNDKGVEPNAIFEMNGGTITAGTTGVAVVNGSSSASGKINKVILNDGTVTGTVTVSSGTLTLDKAASPSGTISVGTYGKLIVNSTWTGSAVADFAAGLDEDGMVSVTNGEANADFKGTLRESGAYRKLVWAEGTNQLMAEDYDFNPGEHNQYSYCEACDAYVQWTPLTAPLGTDVVGGGHYYLTEAYNDNGGNGTYIMAAKSGSWYGNSVCLHLNGKNITTSKAFYLEGQETKLYILGNGGITYTGTSCLMRLNNNTKAYLYGGTYSCTNDVPVLNLTNGMNSLVHLYGTTAINGSVTLNRVSTATGDALATTLYMHDSATVNSITANAKGKLYITNGWNGSIGSVTYTDPASIDAETKLVSTDNAVVAGTLGANASIKLFDDRELVQDGTQLKAIDYSEFAPDRHNGYSYCEVCNAYVTWDKVTGKLGAITYTSDTMHYYLDQSIAFAGTSVQDYFMQTTNGKMVHFNMNGWSIRPAEDAEYAAGPYLQGSMELFNTSETESFWAATCVNAGGSGEMGEFVVRNSATEFVLHDGVTLEATGSNPAQPVVGIFSGTFTLNGGTVTAADKGNVAAVQPRVHNTKSAFVMNSGEVICGTGGTAIRVGQSGSSVSATTNATLKGGTITGTVTANVGTVTLDENASPEGKIYVANYGKLIVDPNWTGAAAAQFAKDYETNLVPVNNGSADDAFEGKLRDFATAKQLVWAEGNRLQLTDNVLTPGEDVFDPEMWAGQAYCPVCGSAEAKKWTALDGSTTANVGMKSDAGTLHYYLKNSYEYGTNAWFANAGANTAIHLNMNGKSISVGTNANKGVLAQKGGSVAIFNTDTANTSSFTAKDNSVYGVATVNDGTITLYSGVKLYTTSVNERPTVEVKKGTFIMEGGEVSALGLDDAAVRVMNPENATGEFILNNGTVTAGNTNAVQVGSSVEADNSQAKFTVNGGSITGTVYTTAYCTLLDLNGAPTLTLKLSNSAEGARVIADGLTANASITLADVVAGVPFTTATADETNKAYFHYGEDDEQIVLKDSCLYIAGAQVDGEWYATAQDAVDDAGENDVVVLAANAAINIDGNVTVDATGNDVTVTGSGTLYAMDSSNKDFDGYGVWTITGVTMMPVTRNDGDIYVLIVNEDLATYSAHYLDIRISAVNLRTSSAGLYYTAEYKCDEKLAANIRSYGVGLSIHTMPTESLDSTCSLTQIYTNGGLADKLVDNTIKIYSGAVTNIFTNDAENAEKNAKNAAIEIYANAYLEIDTVDTDDTLVFGIIGNEDVPEDTGRYGKGAVFTMGKVLEAIDDLVETGSISTDDPNDEKTVASIKRFYNDWETTLTAINTGVPVDEVLYKYDVQNIINLATNA